MEDTEEGIECTDCSENFTDCSKKKNEKRKFSILAVDAYASKRHILRLDYW